MVFSKGVYLCWDLNIRNVEPNAVKMMVRQYTTAETVGLKMTVLDAFLLLVFSPNPIWIITLSPKYALLRIPLSNY